MNKPTRLIVGVSLILAALWIINSTHTGSVVVFMASLILIITGLGLVISVKEK